MPNQPRSRVVRQTRTILTTLTIGLMLGVAASGQTPAADTSLERLRQLAANGDADAEFSLGVRYDAGRGVTEDAAEAANWYRRAADHGSALAQFMLGLFAANGRALPRDDGEAAEWFRKAAEQGYGAAQFRLGVALMDGRGIAKDDVEAFKWLSLAAVYGSRGSQPRYRDARDALAHTMTPTQVADGERRARAWVETFESKRQ
jgi:TPR repeat protein